jgi:hypothetical protein
MDFNPEGGDSAAIGNKLHHKGLQGHKGILCGAGTRTLDEGLTFVPSRPLVGVFLGEPFRVEGYKYGAQTGRIGLQEFARDDIPFTNIPGGEPLTHIDTTTCRSTPGGTLRASGSATVPN